MTTLTAHAHARVGLLGNPSDLYGGRGIGFAVRELTARVTLRESPEIAIGSDILRAAWQLLGIDGSRRPFAITAETNIPFQAGLSGSSALMIAALRAWNAWFALGLSRTRIAELAWRAENEVLGIRAGPLDRLVQSHDGLIAMDFRAPFAAGSVERLDAALLPPMLIAWHGQPTASSGDVHAPIFARYHAGDRAVRRVMEELACNATAGRAALEARDLSAFLACVNRNFDLRSEIFDIAPADRALIALGRSLGAGAKFPGSGGAVLYACRDEEHRAKVDAACRAAGHATLAPTVAPPTPRLRAVFLAAGFATRLYPLTKDKAKPLLEVGGEPMMTRIARQVAALPEVADGVVVANGRFHADFVAWQRGVASRVPLTIVNDGAMTNETRLGAVRDLALALDAAPARDAVDGDIDGYLVLACDNLFEFDLARLVARFASNGRAQLVVRTVPEPVPSGRYSEVLLDPGGTRVTRFREKPQDPQSNLSAIAVYLLPRELPELVRAYLAGGGNPDAPGHFIAWLSERIPLDATPLDGRWIDIGSAEDLARANMAS
jgi:glucose-1-phosphate thymidylyltransferase